MTAAMSWSGYTRMLYRFPSEPRNDEDDADDAGLMKFHTWNSGRATLQPMRRVRAIEDVAKSGYHAERARQPWCRRKDSTEPIARHSQRVDATTMGPTA